MWHSRRLVDMRAAGRIGFLLALWVIFVGVPGCSSTNSTSADGGTTSSTTGGNPPGDPILDGGGEAALPPNGKVLCPAGVCNYQTGEGCPANMRCAPSTMDGVTPACQAAGPTPLDGACVAWGDCGLGSVCAGGFCRKICCGRDWTDCPAQEHCLLTLEVKLPTQTVNTGAFVCYPVNNCDALDPSSCSSIQAGTTCQIADPTGATACLSEGMSGVTESCSPTLKCKAGSVCVNNACRRLCKAVAGGGEPSCPATEGRCVHFTRDPDGVGECTPI